MISKIICRLFGHKLFREEKYLFNYCERCDFGDKPKRNEPPICCAEAFKNVKVTATHLTHLGRSELECAELNSKEWFKHGWEAAIAAMQLTKYDENVSKENVSNANDISVVDVLTRRKPNHTQKDVDNFLGYDVASSTKLVSQREISVAEDGWFIPCDCMSSIAEKTFCEMISVIKHGGSVDVLARCDGKDYRWQCDGLKYAKYIRQPVPVSQREISDAALLSIAAELWPMAQVQTQIGEGIEDAENRIAAFLRPYLRQPVPVSIKDMVDVYCEAAKSGHNIRDTVAIVLKAAGVPYED